MAITGNPVTPMDAYAEALASVGEVAKKRGAASGDGTEPGETRKTPRRLPDAQPSRFSPVGVTLEDVGPQIRFKTIDALVRSQDRLAKNRFAIDTHYDRLFRGVPFSRLEKIPNQSIWVAKLPNGLTKESTAAVPNKAQDLCHKVVDTILADPPKLIAHPSGTDQVSEEAGEFATDFLRLDGGEAGTRDLPTYRWALLTGLIRSTAYLHYRVD